MYVLYMYRSVKEYGIQYLTVLEEYSVVSCTVRGFYPL
jgi:hypothetical protein